MSQEPKRLIVMMNRRSDDIVDDLKHLAIYTANREIALRAAAEITRLRAQIAHDEEYYCKRMAEMEALLSDLRKDEL